MTFARVDEVDIAIQRLAFPNSMTIDVREQALNRE
jgi:hypothetical protein